MEKEQLEKNFHCGLTNVSFFNNPCIPNVNLKEIEKEAIPVYPDFVHFMASSKFDHLNFGANFHNAMTTWQYELFARSINNPLGNV